MTTALQNKYAKGYIAKIKRLEYKARKLQSQLDLTKTQWELYHDTMLKVYPNAWKEYCNENDLAHNYTIGDALC